MSYNRESYKRLGDYIREVDVRNRDLQCTNLLGLSIAKAFIPSIANTVGTDLRSYKVVKHNQFAYVPVTSRNGEKITVALYDGQEDCIISQAYTSFEVKDAKELLPEYLMMWFRRPEFDRYARFKSHGSAREVFDWEEMCEVLMPIPDPIEQQRIVDQYNAMQTRIESNNQIIAILEDTAHALYKKVFVDDIDPTNLPEGWMYKPLEKLCVSVNSGSTPKVFVSDASLPTVNYFKAESIDNGHFVNVDALSKIDVEVHKSMKRSQIECDDILFSMAGTIGKFCIVEKEHVPANTNQAICVIRTDSDLINVNTLFSMFLYGVQTEYCIRNIQEGVQANLSLSNIRNMPILFPPDELLKEYEEKIVPLISYMRNLWKENCSLINIKSLLTTNMA